MQAHQERRVSSRGSVTLDFTVPVELWIDEGGKETRYLRFIDLSAGGLRLSGDTRFPEDSEWTLRVMLLPFGRDLARRCPELTLRLRTVWQRELYGGTWTAGFEFVDLGPTEGELIQDIITHRTARGTEAVKRLNRPMGIGLVSDGEVHWFYSWVLTLSAEEMEMQTEQALIPGEVVSLVLKLVHGRVEVRTKARIEEQEPIGDGRFRYLLRLTASDAEESGRLEEYLSTVR